MRTHLVQVEDRLAARVQGRQLPLPLDTRAGREDLLERDVDRAIVRELQVDKVCPLERGTQRGPELRLERGDAEIAPVLAGIHPITGKAS